MSDKKRLFYWGLFIGAILGLGVIYFSPFFIKIYNPSLQSEAKTNLGGIFVAQVAYFGEYGVYGRGEDCFEIIQWAPEGENRYSYYCDYDVIKNVKGEECPPPDVPHGVTDNSFTVVAVGNIDQDPECDVWTINDAKVFKNVVKDW